MAGHCGGAASESWLSTLSGGGSVIFTNMLNKHYYNRYAWWVRVFGGLVISYLYPYPLPNLHETCRYTHTHADHYLRAMQTHKTKQK